MDHRLHVVIPCAGQGKRFAEAGYTFPKPLISIRGRPMLQWVIESLRLPEAQYHFVFQQEVAERYHVQEMCEQLVKAPHLVLLDGPTEGAACTVLHATAQLPAADELLIANSDQWLIWYPDRFLELARASGAAGSLPVFNSVHPKWSYAKLTKGQLVTEIAEKRPISPWATVGIYWFRELLEFQVAAQRMVWEDRRVNGEFYVAPIYNELLLDGKSVLAQPVEEMWGLGTPEDLEEFKLYICRR